MPVAIPPVPFALYSYGETENWVAYKEKSIKYIIKLFDKLKC